MKKKIIIINQTQFGYNNATYYYCKYLRNDFDITYICWNYNHKKINLNGINIIYVSRNGNIATRNFRFIFKVIKELKNSYQFHIIKYFRGCSVLKLIFPRKKFLVDIRTGSVTKEKANRYFSDFLMKGEVRFFKYVSVISKSLAQKLSLFEKAYILPLGADIISDTYKDFSSINLLYVGTLRNRKIEQTIKGFSKFYREYKDEIKILYTIVGSGFNNEVDELRKLIKHEKIDNVVNITGQIPHNEIKPFFDSHNIGISYVPKTDYFDVQPVTKTFEYLLSGMPVIATDTSENRAVLNDNNGILINDLAEDFYKGLIEIYKKRDRYNSVEIRTHSMKHTWFDIVENFNRYLQQILKN